MTSPVVVSPVPSIQFFNNNGQLAVGYLLFVYLTGTTTKAITYTDYTGSTPNTDPIILNNLGQAPGIFVNGQQSLKFVLAPPNDTDPPTHPVWTIDGITAAQIVLGTIAEQDYDNVSITGGTVAVSSVASTGMITAGNLTLTGQNTNSGVQAATLLNSPSPGNPSVWINLTVMLSDGSEANVVVPGWHNNGATLWDDGGVLVVNNLMAGYPASPLGLPPGSIWSNDGAVSVIAGIVPNPGAPPVFFGSVTAAGLLALGGGNLPLTNPLVLGQLWNNDGLVSIVETGTVLNLYNSGGVLMVNAGAGYPVSSSGLPAGSIWSNSGTVSVVSGVTPNPFAPPVYFGVITAAQLLTLGGGNLPLTSPGSGSGQLWNSSGRVLIA